MELSKVRDGSLACELREVHVLGPPGSGAWSDAATSGLHQPWLTNLVSDHSWMFDLPGMNKYALLW